MIVSPNDLELRAREKAFPDGKTYRSLPVADVAELARESGAPGREVEIAALENGIVPERYARNMRTFSLADQAVLLKARAGVVGLGGLGGAVVEILARVGVGRLVLVDGDRFEDSNLNRQLLSSVEGLSRPKADSALRRVAEINPSVAAEAHAEFLTAENADGILQGCDVVVDCLDNLPSRFDLEDACRRIGSPLVAAAVAGTTGHVMTIFPEDRGLRLVYGEPRGAPRKGAETALGTVPFAVVLLASLECAEAVKILLKRGGLLRQKLLVADLMEGVIEVMRLG
jgi:molybdopterin/thiamine biosynthesis adenylyltransferase